MRWLAALLLLLLALPATAQTGGPPSPVYKARADELVAQLAAPGKEDSFFSRVFLDAVPVEQWRALAAQLRTANGTPERVSHIAMETANIGAVEIRYSRATVGFQLVIAPQAPHQVIGLRLTGAKQAGDSMASVMADLAALPGQTAFAVARLTDQGPVLLASANPGRQMATGSSFKLYILAELARASAAGEHAWGDVTPLSHKSFSGRLARMPDGAPMTLHSLALGMIAESDNSATDTLLLALGRDKVDAMLGAAGHADPVHALPMLTTSEAFALKMPANADLRAQYVAASPAGRLTLLRDHAARLGPGAVDVSAVAERPTAIDEIEWFAAPNDGIRVLNWLRRNGGDALPILAVNPGIAPGDAARWAYLGYKGGSEPGVIAMNFLARAKDGQWYAVSGSWNDPAARLDENRFVGIMTRLLNLLADGKDRP